MSNDRASGCDQGDVYGDVYGDVELGIFLLSRATLWARRNTRRKLREVGGCGRGADAGGRVIWPITALSIYNLY